MKKRLSIFLSCMYGFCFCSIAQVSEQKSIIPILNDAEYHCDKLHQEYYSISKFEIDQVNGSVSRYTPLKLIGGKEYKILLFGELDRIDDLDLKIYGKSGDDWILVKWVNKSGKILETDFETPDYESYEFEIGVQKYAPGYDKGRYCLIVAF